MKKLKHLLITTDTESNIGVLTMTGTELPLDKLKLALHEHFDYPVDIHSTKMLSEYPLHFVAECSFEDGDTFSVGLNLTWVY